jgi:hypothetical protein
MYSGDAHWRRYGTAMYCVVLQSIMPIADRRVQLKEVDITGCWMMLKGKAFGIPSSSIWSLPRAEVTGGIIGVFSEHSVGISGLNRFELSSLLKLELTQS